MNKDEYPLHITHNNMVVRLYQQQSCEIPQVKQSKPTQMQHDCSIKDDVVMTSSLKMWMARFLFVSVYSFPYLYQVDYKVLAERLAKKLEDHGNESLLLTLRMILIMTLNAWYFFIDIKYKFEKLEYLREIQRLKSAISCYQESENFAGKDVSLI